MSGQRRMAASAGSGSGKARHAIDRPPVFRGWHSSDAEEIERRRWRGRSEIVEVEPLEPAQPYFGAFRVRSASGTDYLIEIRSLVAQENSCACHDFMVNGLGTCKHIEGTLHFLSRRGRRAFRAAAREGSGRVEIYAFPGEMRLRVAWPTTVSPPAAGSLLASFELGGEDAGKSIPALRAALAAAPPETAAQVRVSRHLEQWIDARERANRDASARESLEAEVRAGRTSLEVLRLPLLPYQKEGMLHLAFGRRALLADEMGLGKTVQAIAACELLRRLEGIERVLVVSPASLKSEWEEQIRRFSELPAAIVQGNRALRLQQYRRPAFFHLANYEQILPDLHEINNRLRPDVVILDEAQRIKNWQTKTARAVKLLRSPYAFVLTGTPLENRIDEVYSIVQYLDPAVLGPLFRFNRDFYVLDERGRPIDYKNLDELHRRLKPVMLRRRKSEVEDQLPARTTKTYFVAMTEEQKARYAEYERRVARLVQASHHRPLTAEEFERLQRWLACMRMLCDTPFILDSECRDCPKLDELERLLGELLADPQRKIIIFSEWERMLKLVRELVRAMDLDHGWHTGSVPQQRRRAEINRFKHDPGCRLFLSTDSGSVGLNLQAADTVINLDMPWNPAKLEQRIARAWRKHQTRPVRALNLVTEHSIEQRMLQLLSGKQDLADGVLDGRGDLGAIRMPSGRAAFLQRLEAALNEPAAPVPVTAEALRDGLRAEYGESLLLMQVQRNAAGDETLLVVVEGDPDAARRDIEQRIGSAPSPGLNPQSMEVLDRATWQAVARLVAGGTLAFTDGPRELHRAAGLVADTDDRQERRQQARDLLNQAERKRRMAALLAHGGFAGEALEPLDQAEALANEAAGVLDGEDTPAAAPSAATAGPQGDAQARLAATSRLIETIGGRLKAADERPAIAA